MIDTHLYSLPGIDDRPETLQESSQLAEALVQERDHLKAGNRFKGENSYEKQSLG